MTAHEAALDTDVVWAETRRGLLAFVLRRVATRDDAEDIVQDTLTRMHASLSGLRDGERITAWAYGIARNAITDHYRARAKATNAYAELGMARRDDAQAAPDADAPEAELAACMRPFVDRLPAPYGDALRHVEFDGITQVEAARRADVSVSGMKSRVQRGRAMVRAMLGECCDIELAASGGVAAYERRGADSCSRC